MAALLFADRFLIADQARAIDLATGDEVTLKPLAFAASAPLEAWLRRCAALMDLHHASLVPLVDFGLAGCEGHFEALACRRTHARWTSRDGSTMAALRGLAGFLHARGLSAGALDVSPGALDRAHVLDVGGRPAWLPDRLTGSPLPSPGRDRPDAGSRERGQGRLAVTERERLSAILQRLAEVLDLGVSGRPRALDVFLPAGLEHRRAINAIARESRLRGYVPVHPALFRRLGTRSPLQVAIEGVLHGRHVVVLHDGTPPLVCMAAHLFLSLGLDSDRPHVLLVIREGGVRYADAPTVGRSDAGLRAREQQAGYITHHEAPPPHGVQALRACRGYGGTTVESELARSRSKILPALDTASSGRHATAARALREIIGMLTRREDLPGAGAASLALGRVLLSRGQVVEAAVSFEDARRWYEQAGLTSRSIEAALFVGLAWTDAGRWLEAEAAIRAALIAATTIDDRGAARFAGLVLSRCLFWQGRPRDAQDALPAETDACSDRVSEAALVPFAAVDAAGHGRLDERVVRACLAARIAMSTEDLRAAGLAAASARERATLAGRPAELALACTTMAGVYAGLGDAAALRLQVDEGLRAARLAHVPLRALRLRAVLAHGLVRAGKAAEARSLLARLSRLDLDSLPAVVRRQVEGVLQLKSGAAGHGRTFPFAAVHRPLARPFGACPTGPFDPGDRGARPEVVDTVIEILDFCQSMEDEEALARKVMGTLRVRAGAAVAACFGLLGQGVVPIAAEGRDPAPGETAQRAADLGLAIAPGASASGLEGAVPIRFGGRVIGALACRWAADTAPDWPATGALLAAAAAAIAPSVRGALDRRAVPAIPRDASSDDIVGASQAVRALREEIERAARAPFNVVIEGESGSGKELVARAIHRLGPRRHHRLCAINCAALTDELLEAELFGHARGAFTGAVAERKGLFEEADGGTLVLDEVGELTPRAQAKLLRAIQEGEVRRLGENFSRPVDTRIVAASNRALRPAVDAGTFRRDLLYRLEVIRIVVPPLRERVDDIPLLAAHFWQQATARLGSRATLAPGTLAALARYEWPGNVRELQNVTAALAVAAGRRGSVGPERLPGVIGGQAAVLPGATLDEARRVFEARFVRAALARAGGHRAQAARDLGLTRQGLSKLLARLAIDPDAAGAPKG